MNPPHKKNRRWRLVADVRIQGELLIRLFIYWVLFHFAQYCTIAVFTFLNGGESVSGTSFLVPATIASFILLPIVMLDSLRFSNRFVGPFVNVRNKLVQLSEGEVGYPIKFRQGDFLMEVATAYNLVRERYLQDCSCQPTENELSDVQAEEPCHG